jgi:hypothetical protein
MDHRDRPVAQSLARAGRPFSYLRDPPSARCWPSLALRALTGVQRPSRWAALSAAAMLPSARVLHPRSHRHGSGIPVRWLYTRVAPSHAVQLSAVYLDRNVEEILPAPRVQADCGAQAGTCLDNPPLRRKCSLSLRQAQIPSRRWRALRRTRCRRHQGDEAGVRPSLQIRRPTMLNALAISIGAVGLG